MHRLRASAALALLGATAHAEDVQVISPRPDSVSVTIYRDLFALITETRTVELPDGPVTLVFDGVVETLIPQSAVVVDTQRPVAESNFDFERVTPAALLDKSIGKQVTLTRTNRATGKAGQVAATVIAANTDGVVFRTTEGNEALYCSGLPEMLTFESIPDDLHAAPRLSIRLAAGAPGKRQVRVSYLAHGFAWSADYLAFLGAQPGGQTDTGTMDLAGWITLRNLTDSTFRNAEVQLVAGKLNLLDAEEERGSSLYGNTQWAPTDEALQSLRDDRLQVMIEELAADDDDRFDADLFYGCYPLGNTSMPGSAVGYVDSITAQDIGKFPGVHREAMGVVGSEDLEEVIVTGFRASMAVRENLADYQLYRLPVHTDLNARQTKQVAFLRKPEVKVDRFYGLRIAADEDYDPYYGYDEDSMPLSVKVAWRNREADGLGEPLPAGLVRFFSGESGGVFVGDARIEDSAVGTPVEVSIGRATDLTLNMEGSAEDVQPTVLSLLTWRAYQPLSLRIDNAKSWPVTVEIRQGQLSEDLVGLRVVGANLRPQRKAGDYLWRLTVPANGTQLLKYKVGGRARLNDYDE